MAGVLSWLHMPAWVQDLLLAGFVTLFQIRGTILVWPGQQSCPAPADDLRAGWVRGHYNNSSMRSPRTDAPKITNGVHFLGQNRIP